MKLIEICGEIRCYTQDTPQRQVFCVENWGSESNLAEEVAELISGYFSPHITIRPQFMYECRGERGNNIRPYWSVLGNIDNKKCLVNIELDIYTISQITDAIHKLNRATFAVTEDPELQDPYQATAVLAGEFKCVLSVTDNGYPVVTLSGDLFWREP